jgi:hypothetical protein
VYTLCIVWCFKFLHRSVCYCCISNPYSVCLLTLCSKRAQAKIRDRNSNFCSFVKESRCFLTLYQLLEFTGRKFSWTEGRHFSFYSTKSGFKVTYLSKLVPVAVRSAGLRPLDCSDCVLELPLRHGCLTWMLCVVLVEDAALDRSFFQGSPIEFVCVHPCVTRCKNNPLHLQKCRQKETD